MIIIYAQINTDPNKEGQSKFRYYMTGKFNKQGFNNIFFAYTIVEIIDLAQDYKDEPFWIFSNFPPDSSYVDGATPKVDINNETTYWDVDGYDRSYNFFSYLLNNNSVIQWNIITGAPSHKLLFQRLKEINNNVTIRFVRKGELMNNGIYYLNLNNYIEKEIKRFKIEQIINV